MPPPSKIYAASVSCASPAPHFLLLLSQPPSIYLYCKHKRETNAKFVAPLASRRCGCFICDKNGIEGYHSICHTNERVRHYVVSLSAHTQRDHIQKLHIYISSRLVKSIRATLNHKLAATSAKVLCPMDRNEYIANTRVQSCATLPRQNSAATGIWEILQVHYLSGN